MKNRIIYLLVVCALLAAGIWLAWSRKQAVQRSATNAIAQSHEKVSRLDSTKNGGMNEAQQIEKKHDSNQNQAPSKVRQEPPYLQKIRADPQYDWKQPINFYGRVVDENNVPVANANAHFQWTDLSPTGTSQADAKSDSKGFFSLVGRTGKYMTVTVNKDGYYTYPLERLRGFEYASPYDGLFTPDAGNPVVFHLRKKGVGVDLITHDFAFSVGQNGIPIGVDLLQGKKDQDGQMKISQNKPEYKKWKQATEWSFKIEIPDGGFFEENDEFPFEAPDSGYQPVVEFNFQQGQTEWITHLNKDYYIKFGTPPRYGCLHLQTSINTGVRLQYSINPTGSRNLEPK